MVENICNFLFFAHYNIINVYGFGPSHIPKILTIPTLTPNAESLLGVVH